MPLTNTAIKATRGRDKQSRLTDGQGMYLLVKPNGKKYWRLDYSLHGRRKTFAIGSYPAISLKEARSRRDAAKALVSEGIDPVQHRKIHKQKRMEAAANTFEAVVFKTAGFLETKPCQNRSWPDGKKFVPLAW